MLRYGRRTVQGSGTGITGQKTNEDSGWFSRKLEQQANCLEEGIYDGLVQTKIGRTAYPAVAGGGHQYEQGGKYGRETKLEFAEFHN